MMKLNPTLSAVLLTICLATPSYAADKKHHAQASENDAPPAKPAHNEPVAGSTWTDSKTGMEFLWIPSGCFEMGSEGGDKDEVPVHKVCVKGFYLGKYEVTQAQYQAVNGTNPSKFRGASNPVETVSHSDAKGMAEELSYQTNEKFRLPTEAEWEYACRAGGQHSEYCGPGSLDRLGWYGEDYKTGSTHPVGQKRPNAWGLYDMSGNVWEWVEDTYHDSYNGAPKDGKAWMGGENRVLRGGSWNGVPQVARAAIRIVNGPSKRRELIGFRLARTLP